MELDKIGKRISV